MTPRSLQEKHTAASTIRCSILPGCKLCNTFFRSLTLRSQMDESALEKLRTHFTEEYICKNGNVHKQINVLHNQDHTCNVPLSCHTSHEYHMTQYLYSRGECIGNKNCAAYDKHKHAGRSTSARPKYNEYIRQYRQSFLAFSTRRCR